MAKGRIQKALSGFYYVDTGSEILRCRARGKFRKEGVSPLVGDMVEVRELGSSEGFVEAIAPRKNAFARPAVANIDQLVIIASQAIPKTEHNFVNGVCTVCGAEEGGTVVPPQEEGDFSTALLAVIAVLLLGGAVAVAVYAKKAKAGR